MGVGNPTASWGDMIKENYSYITAGVCLYIIPGLVTVLSVLSLVLLGNYFRDSMDAKGIG